MAPPARQKELEAQVEECKNQIEALTKRNAADKAQMQTAIEMEKRLRTQAQTDAAEAKSKAEELLQVTTTLQQDKDALEIAIATAQANEQHMLDAYNSVEAQLREANALNEQLDADNHTHTSTIKQLQDQLERASIAEATYQAELTAAVARANELEVQFAQSQANIDTSSSSLQTELMERDERLKSMKLDHQSQLLEHESIIDRLQSELSDTKTKVENLQCELTALQESGNDKYGTSAMVKGLQQELFDTSTALVAQGEKMLTLTEAFNKCKSALQVAKKDVGDARSFLLRGISGPEVDVSLYQHVKLEDLVRLRLKAEVDMETVLDDGGQEDVEVQSDIGLGMGTIGKLEREMRLLRSRNKRLSERSVELEKELASAVAAMDDVKALKEKTAELASRQRTEKELRSRTDSALVEANEKIVALSEHIEKLMMHLKHEAAAKAKAQDGLKTIEMERKELTDTTTSLSKKITTKDRIISELQQGSKILEDQLRLMDEKYIELRNKLDWTRTTNQKENRKLQQELSALRCKWQMAVDTGQVPADSYIPSTLKPLKKMTLSGSASESRMYHALNHSQNNRTDSHEEVRTKSPPPSSGKKASFDIPKLPQPDGEDDMPWSDAKLNSLQRQFGTQEKNRK